MGPPAEVDRALLSEVELLVDSTSCHHFANLAGTYQTAVKEAKSCPDPGYLALILEAERDLRRFLVELRFKQAGLASR